MNSINKTKVKTHRLAKQFANYIADHEAFSTLFGDTEAEEDRWREVV